MGRIRIHLLLMFALVSGPLTAQVTDSIYYVDLKMTGVYQGKSLYVQNPYYTELGDFCVKEIRVNKKRVDLNYKISALRIDFDGISENSPVYIDVNHIAHCAPKIVNPVAIQYHSNFKFTHLMLNDTSLYWEIKGELPEGKYRIEQLMGDDWGELEVINAKGIFEGTSYEYPAYLSRGSNKFRIKYELPSGRYLYSDELEYVYYKEPVTFNIAANRMIFSKVTDYEIVDAKGRTILRGEGKEIPLRAIRPGQYVIYFDGGDQSEGFVKK